MAARAAPAGGPLESTRPTAAARAPAIFPLDLQTREKTKPRALSRAIRVARRNPGQIRNRTASQAQISLHPSPLARRDWPCRKRSEEHTSELQSRLHLVCRLLLDKKRR